MNIDMDDFKKPEHYYTKLKDISDTSDFLLDDYKKLYVISKINPENQEYQQQFLNIDDNVKQINTRLFAMSADLKHNIKKLTEFIISLDNTIKTRRKTKKDLTRKLGIVEHESNASSEMIDDYKEIYNERYLRNWAMGISIVSGFLVIKWMFNTKTQGV
jgi:hypothetical protein